MKVAFRASLFILGVVTCCLAVAAPAKGQDRPASLAVAACQVSLESPRTLMLQSLLRLENDFVKMNWHYFNYVEVTYRPLWKARQMKEDPFSPSRHATGTVLVNRYQHEADAYLADAQEFAESMEEHFADFEQKIAPLENSCSSWDFQDCSLKWQGKVTERVNIFRELLFRHMSDLEELASAVSKTLYENPSEHHVYRARYHAQWDHFYLEVYPQFIYLLRDLREQLQYHWVGDSCCAQCTERKVEVAENPFYTMMEADPEGYRGLQANIVNQQNLADAFEEFEQGIESGKLVAPEEPDEEE